MKHSRSKQAKKLKKSHKIHRSRPILSYSLSRDLSNDNSDISQKGIDRQTSTADAKNHSLKGRKDRKHIKQHSRSTLNDSIGEITSISQRIRTSFLAGILQSKRHLSINNTNGNVEDKGRFSNASNSLESQRFDSTRRNSIKASLHYDTLDNELSNDQSDELSFSRRRSQSSSFSITDRSASSETIVSQNSFRRSCCQICSIIFITFSLLLFIVGGYFYLYDAKIRTRTDKSEVTSWYPLSSSPSIMPSQVSQTSSPSILSTSSHPDGDKSSTTFPSLHPSTLPPVEPSMMPSSQTSSNPTTNPTEAPRTAIPSTHPTTKTSYQPTIHESSQPSLDPTLKPYQSPSTVPTTISTTKLPSDKPSSQPNSISPSSSPTMMPSNHPTTEPSTQPSMLSSTKPSSNPTSYPTSKPSASPSTAPSTIQPTSLPSNELSMHPTTLPSLLPSESNQPSLSPTMIPSNHPTTEPSTHPSMMSSTQPSSNPTSKPSQSPSIAPSTSLPTNLPSNKPSNPPTLSLNPSHSPDFMFPKQGVEGTISCGSTIQGDTTNGVNFYTYPAREHFYSFSLTAASQVVVDACQSQYDTVLRVYDADSKQLAVNDDDCGFQSKLILDLEEGNYYIMIEGYASSSGEYIITMTCNNIN